ncbi:MAG: EAL domain-containing protein [Ruminococcaceae bacterium]|nr:EAL domain-containing protein [Oscillospiraceae bacterium]
MDKLKHTLLIVDDAEINLAILTEIFECKYNILTATNGEQALEIMRAHSEIDVVLLDLIMPEMSGYQVLDTMCEDEKLQFLPVIVITARDDTETEYKVFELGAVDFISRPFNHKTVEKRVDSVIHRLELGDIKSENRIYQSQAESKKLLSALMNNLPGGVAIIDTDGKTAKCSYYNGSVPNLFGFTPEEFLKEFEEKDAPQWIKEFAARSQTQDRLSFDFSVEIKSAAKARCRADGDHEDHADLINKNDTRTQWIRLISSLLNEENGIKSLYCVFLDINVEKNQELKAQEADKRLKNNEIRLESMINNAPGGVVLCEQSSEDSGLKVLYCSRGLSEMMGCLDYDRFLHDIIMNASDRVINSSDIADFRKKLHGALTAGRSVEHVFRCLDYTDNLVWMQIHGQITENDKGGYSLYGFVTDITKEKEFQQELHAGAYFDALTGIYNRNAFFVNARNLIDSDPHLTYAVMRFNIGNFKLINDIMGREIGDRVLICVAETLRRIAPTNAVYGRFFADSFALITPQDAIEPEAVLDAVKNAIKDAKIIPHDVQYYMGVYIISDNNTRIDDVCDRALMACRSVTGSLNKHIAYYDDRMRLEMLEEQEICDEANRAIENNEFCIYYQSVYGIKAKRFVSAEALVRWKHPTKGLIPPGKFIPVFERNGFIAKLDLYILEQVCKYQKKRNDLGLPEFPISVNVSRMSLYNPNLFDIINGLTTKYGVSPQSFRIEVTESAYNDNPAQLLETIGKLREKEYPILMDDFGSGYSSLNTLKDIPIDLLKLDMKFMQGFETNSRVGTIVTSVARMSKWLNTPMLAEGVETKEQFEFLKSVGCAYIQGYYFAKPIPEEEFTELIAKESVTPLSNTIESYGISDEINEILGSSALVSKLISGAFGGFGIYELTDNRLEVVRVNEGYMQIMGYTPEDFNGEHSNVWEKIMPDDIHISQQACYEAWNSNKPVRATVRRYDKNGKLLYLDGVHRMLGGSEESPIFCIAFNDITDQIESDRVIRQSRDRISNILDATGSVVVDIDFVGDNIFCAGDASEFGIKVQELAEMIKTKEGLTPITHPDEWMKMLEFHNRRSAQRSSEDFRIKNVYGDYSWFRFTKSLSFDEKGNVTRLMGIINNIDAQKRAAQKLESAQEQINVTMNSINAGILISEVSDGNEIEVMYGNDAFWNLIGAEPSNNFDVVAHIEKNLPADKMAEIHKRATNQKTVQFQFNSRRLDGTESWVELTLSPTKSFVKGKRRYLAILEDVTEQHRATYQINQIVSNFDCGLGLISRTEGEISLPYANDKFFKILNISEADHEHFNSCIKEILETEANDIDKKITDNDGTERIVKIHRSKIDSGNNKEEDYIIVTEDVTLKRAEAKNRIAERKSNALRGLYDEVFKVNYHARTSLMVACRRNPQRARNARPMSLDYVIGEWTEKNVHPDDRERARELFESPTTNPDFNDIYAEIRLAVPHTKDQYTTFGMVMVRSGPDTCMLFFRDLSRIDTSATTDEFAEVNRLYQLVAEQTNTTVIEYDHITEKITVSPSISMYAAAALSNKEFAEREHYIKGLAIHPDDREDFAEFSERVVKSDHTESIILRMEMADKSYKWCRLSITLTRSNSGEVLSSLCTINLVHDEVEARRRAESIDKLMRKTVKHLPVGVGIYKMLEGTPVPLYLSDNIYTIFGINDTYKNIDPKITRDFISNNKLEAGKEGEYTQHCVRPDGSTFWLNTKYYVRDEDGDIMLYAALDDVSEQVEAHRSREVQEQMYQLLLEETGTVIFHYDNETDEFFYIQPSNEEFKNTKSISNYSRHFEEFTLIDEKDRERFAREIERLSEQEDSTELVVSIDVDGYPRRFRCFLKSMEDMDGAVFRIIGKIEDVDDEINHLEKIKAKAMYDSLCVDIYNKSTTEELIRAELERSTGGSLLMIDVDDFKSINDNLGHVFGDEFLKKFATTIKSTFRDSDIVGRYGGDEFFVYLNHANASLAVKKSEQILEKIAQIEIPEIGFVKSSIGVTAVNPDNRDYTQIIRQADSALYTAKNKGKNQVVLFDPATMTESAYRTKESGGHSGSNPALSSNPRNSADLIMRIFSALYSSRDLSTGIEQMLELAGKTYDVSRAYIFEDSDDGSCCNNTFEWCNEGVRSQIGSLQNISYKDDLGGVYRNNMNDDGIFYCHDITKLEGPQKAIFARQNIKSVLQCAIIDKGEFKGFVGFDECRSNRFWTQSQIDALAFISKVISIFLLKDRNTRISENYSKYIKATLDNSPQYIYIMEKETKKLLYLNNMAKEMSPKGILGRKCNEVICGIHDENSCPICVLQETGDSKPVDMLNRIINKKVRAHASEVEWEGKKAYLVICSLIEE